MAGLLARWHARRTRKRAEAEAKHLMTEARRILRKKSYRIPESVAAEIEQAIAVLDQARGGEDLEPVRQALSALDEKIDQHLAFARKSSLREYSESIVVAVAIALFLRAFVVEAFQIPSGSMIPTLEVGDHIFVSKFAYGVGIPFTDKKIVTFGEPRRGDVIVFKYPLGPETDYIKRVVGLPGDEIRIRRNEIFINGEPLPRENIDGPCRYSEGPRVPSMERRCDLWIERLDGNDHQAIYEPGRVGSNFGPKVVDPGSVFVMGDNRDNSNDSRVWGTVPLDLIKGKALVVWWSRGPTQAGLSIEGIGQWFKAIRWRRFFHLVQ